MDASDVLEFLKQFAQDAARNVLNDAPSLMDREGFTLDGVVAELQSWFGAHGEALVAAPKEWALELAGGLLDRRSSPEEYAAALASLSTTELARRQATRQEEQASYLAGLKGQREAMLEAARGLSRLAQGALENAVAMALKLAVL